MLQSLSISNYTLIQELEIAPDRGLNIVTGETGAGKSIILGALGLLLGNRADTKALLDHSRKCIVEGVFDISPYELAPLFRQSDLDYEAVCLIRREISPGGKSRAFVNDELVNLEFLKLLGERLMDVHSQHDTLLLGSRAFQLGLVDSLAQNGDLKQVYAEQYREFLEKKGAYETLVRESSELKKEADYHRFLFDELEKAGLQPGEQEKLESSLSKLEHTEEIKLKLNEALTLLDQTDLNINGLLFNLKQVLAQISPYGSPYETLKTRIESALIELKDITADLEREEAGTVHDPEGLQETRERLSLLYELQQKHQVNSVEELLHIREKLSGQLLRVENLEETIAAAKKARGDALEKVNRTGDQLSRSRQAVFATFESQVTSLLNRLGMLHAKLVIEHQATEPGEDGKDRIEILFSANKGIDPQPLKKVASGGEFSRLMFAIKYILADKTALPTLVFDEIDAGVSGEIAIQMARMIREMARNHQIIAITHLPQIAAQGETHYFVFKEDREDLTSSGIRRLDGEERLHEIAQMIGGKQLSDQSIKSARELMALP